MGVECTGWCLPGVQDGRRKRGSVGRMVVVKGFLDLGVSKGVDLATVVITSTKSLNED